ncbi:MAG: cytochrome d ubiquinol oxidase subunit II [Planctomycetota bacterium]|nr:cytochrome d ubiquinol oxidase subunit II [Planctomycetota bacterium]
MPEVEVITAWVMLIALLAYTLLGGADFGGGVWDLFASGRTKERQRETVSDAIGPIWEANHVWLIVVVVLMFAGFPRAFSAMMTALHVPVTLMLIGIVLRGSAFAFRAYDPSAKSRGRWGRVFSVSSLVTPLLLGVSLAGIVAGNLEWNDEGAYVSGFIMAWLTPFHWAVGVFTLVIFAYLAAVYLCVATRGDRELNDAFRGRAIAAGIALAPAALATYLTAPESASHFVDRFAGSWWTWPLQIGTGLMAAGGLVALFTRRFRIARVLVAGQVTFIVLGFGAAQYPMLVAPGFTIENSSANSQIHVLLLGALGAGSLVLLPSLALLYRVFKGGVLVRADGSASG